MNDLYNPRFRILFKWDPLVQAVIGRFEGYMLVLEAITETRDHEEGDEVEFVYAGESSWKECVNHIREFIAQTI